jgi:hypothetical protein
LSLSLPGSPFRNSIVVAADVACTVAVNVFQPWDLAAAPVRGGEQLVLAPLIDCAIPSVCELFRAVATAADFVEEVEQLADLEALLGWVAHLGFLVDQVAVAPAASFAFEEPGFGEVDHYPLGCSFGDADCRGDVSEPDVGIVGDAKQHLGVVCEERPVGCAIA